MGEIAEMMLDGTLCEACGAYIGNSSGFPGYCSRLCAKDSGADRSAQDIADEAHFWRTGEFPEDRKRNPQNPPGSGSAKTQARKGRRDRSRARQVGSPQ